MKEMIKKLVVIILFLLLVPTAFAMENDTMELAENNDVDLLTSNDYYFDASVMDGGDGSIENPYNNLENNIKANSVNHLGNGEYDLGENVLISDVSFIGQDAEKTIINGHGEVLNNSKSLFFKNVTLLDFNIINKGTLTCENSIFSYGYGFGQDKYGNSFGGAIYTPYLESKKVKVTITNCTFENNYAEYGGAIYMDGGELNIVDSRFINNTAYNYGGAIACEYNTQLNINRTLFINSRSINDAGGAIYLKLAVFNSNRVDIINSTSTFGGAITALNTDITITRLNAYNNTVKYDGGAIYQLYGKCSIQQSNFINNTAKNGAGVFLDNLTSALIISNRFEGNNASLCAGAIYSIANPKLTFQNIFKNNHAFINNDLFETTSYDPNDIGKGNYTIYINDDSFDGEVPEYYNLNDYGYVSSIKNQLYGGNCWSFSALAALESCILKASGKEYDLSEENMKNLIELYSDYGWSMDTNQGGYNNMAIGYLTSWLGPIGEMNDSYDDYSTLSPMLDSLMHIQNVLFLKRDNYTDNDAIKKAILKYGSVSTGICYYPEYLKGNSYYCYKLFDYPNHAVSIVGWNDTYSKDNFWGNPEVDGAWIVKNSWGESWGDDGFFYVSYCDKKLAQVGVAESVYTFILNDSMRYDKNYQYDVIGKTSYYSSNENQIYYQNIFKATDDEILAGVSTHFEKMSNWDLSVYVNDVLKLTQNGVSDAGYYTLRLNEVISLKKGDTFKVVFKISGNDTFRIPISEKSYANKFLSKEGLSFFSYDGEKWFDLYTSSAPSVASLKAFTLLNKLNTKIALNVSDNQLNPVEIIANIVDEYGNIVKSGNVTFIAENENYIIPIINGTAKFHHNFTSGGLNNVSAVFEGECYNRSISTSNFHVNITDSFILCNESVFYYGINGYSIKLVDDNDTGLASKKIIFTINGQIYENITDNQGICVVYPVLTIGNHEINIAFLGDDKYIKSKNQSNISVKSTIVKNNNDKFTLNSKYWIKLLDCSGLSLANADVDIFIGSRLLSLKTDNNGEINLRIDLNPGKYELKVINPINNESLSTNFEVIPRITENKDINAYLGSKNVYKVHIFDDYGNNKEGMTVKFAIGNNVFYENTDKNGYAYIKLSVKNGKYTVTAEYNGFMVSNKIIIKSTLITKNKSIKKGKMLKFKAKLVNSKGKPIKGKKITFKMKSKRYIVKTNKKGVATVKIKKLKVGKYTIETSYKKIKVKNKITVK
jgi:predicted outer membrane repeat protein